MSFIETALNKLGTVDTKFVAVGGVVCGVLYYAMAYNSGDGIVTSINQVKEQIEAATVVKKETEKLLANQIDLRREQQELGNKFQLALQQLPREQNVAEILSYIQSLAKAAGARVTDIEPGRSEPREIYEEMAVNVTLVGNFSEITQFLSDISKIKRIIKIRELRIDPQSKVSKALIAKVQLISYRYIGEDNKKNSSSPQGAK